MSTDVNLVYAIICSNCGEFYVGETKTELRTRMTVHRQQTRHQDLTIIRANEHFHDCSGGHFKISPLYKVNTEGDFLRRRKETKKRTKRIFHNILVLTFSLLLQIFRYNVYKCLYMTLTIV
jgi:hypothetical protein